MGQQAGDQLPEKQTLKKVAQVVPQLKQDSIWQQAVAKLIQIPWGHNLVTFSKCKNITEALYYVSKTIEHNWSRNVLTHQIESGLYQREGKAVTNFTETVPAPLYFHSL
ncbi:MAG: DUF1016 family protein [Candidatus Electrothrix sp. ATG2]|nr:DUF1016 family protein [Candidatus Electrothrix sp. ATG2]